MKRLLPAVLLFALPGAFAQLPPDDMKFEPALREAPRAPTALYIAGAKLSLEQTFADAMLENFGPGGALPFVIVATGPEIRKLTLKGAKRPVKNAVLRLQQAGGKFYLCDRDLRQAGLGPKDLLPGVVVERALKKEEAAPAGTKVTDDLLRVRHTCS